MTEDQDSEEPSTSHPNPFFDDAGPLADPQERRIVFAALDSFQDSAGYAHAHLPTDENSFRAIHRTTVSEEGRYVLSETLERHSFLAPIPTPSFYPDSNLCLNEDLIHKVHVSAGHCFGQAIFQQYRKNAHYNTTHRRRQNLYALPSAQWQMIAAPPFSILDTLNAVDDALDHNADLADEIFQLGLAAFGLPEKPPKNSALDWPGKAKSNDISKAHSTIRQFYRDWSHEGFTLEVEPLLKTILANLEPQLQPIQLDAQPPSVLLPGAGLGRILFELALRGYHATGNEISYHQLLASNFILNSTQRANQYPIYPFAHTFTNVTSRSNQLKRHTVPDVHPGEAFSQRLAAGLPVGEMNMAAGDFVLSYSTPECKETFDGVVSVFFIDTAPNLVRYIETVRNCLRSGGIWINIGPLLWHFDDRAPGGSSSDDEQDDNMKSQRSGHLHEGKQSHSHSTSRSQLKPDLEDKGIAEPGSFELTDEEVILLVSGMGFEVVKHEILDTDTGYIQDPHSLLQNRYKCSHWVARKVDHQ